MSRRCLFALGVFLCAASTPGMFVVLGQKSEQQDLPYETGRKILHSQGPEAAIAYFEKLATEKGSLKGLFGLGWAWWEDGNIEEAELITKFVLKRAKGDNLKGNCNFLLGYIYSQKGQLQAAEMHMSDARDIYEKRSKLDNLFKATCGVASIQIKSQNFLEAEETLAAGREVLERFEKSQGPKPKRKLSRGYYYELLSRVAFGLGHYSQALAHSKDSYDHYSNAGDKVRSVQALSAVGFYKIINGYIEEGLEDTKRVDEEIYLTKSEYKRLSYYNAINWVIAYRCTDHDYSDLEQSIREGILNNEDLLLQKQLKFALTWNCGR